MSQYLIQMMFQMSNIILSNPAKCGRLIFPNLAAGNVTYNILKELGDADAVGPILLGLKKPVHILQLGSSVRSIVNMALIAVVEAQIKCRNVSTEEIVKRSPWWKRLRKANRES